MGEFVYARIDQGVVDGAVRGAGMAASGTGAGLSKMQSGKVQQYGVLLFAGVVLTGVGYAYSRLGPDNERLFWDRLPMTIA